MIPTTSPNRSWLVASRIGEAEQEALNVDSLLLAQLLWNRGVRSAMEARAFVEPDLKDLADPWLLSGVSEAVQRLQRGLAAGETIAVYGDYDVDGVSGAALLERALRRLGARVQVHLPDRARDGYGVHADAVRHLAADGARVIITVDCGISANEQVLLAAELGTDVIVTDHHTVPTRLPAAAAVLNPHQPGCAYPFKDLAGGGVAFQLARALLATALHGPELEAEIRSLTPFAALSTVADVMPLLGENRTIVAAGLEQMRAGTVPGLRALCERAGRAPESLTARDLAFTLIPRLNAASRMGDAHDALALLTAPDEASAAPIAERLEIANQARRARMEEILLGADAEASVLAPAGAIVLAGDYPVGLAGLVAARVSDRFKVPCVVIEHGDETSRGSVRGAGVHLVRALEACTEDLIQFGGHERAAGFSMRTEYIDSFRAAFVEAVSILRTEGVPEPTASADGVLRLASVGPRLANLVGRFEPTGAANDVPTFISRGVRVLAADVVRGGHCRLRMGQGRAFCRGIAFRPVFPIPLAGETVDVLYTVDQSEWQGEVRVEIVIRDLQPSMASASA